MAENYKVDLNHYGPPDSAIAVTELHEMERWLTDLAEGVEK